MPHRVRFRIFRSADFRSEKWFSPQVFTIERQQVESERDRTLVIYPTMQGVEIRHTIRTNPNDLGIDDCGPVDPRSTLDNQRIAFRPVGTVHRVEPNPTIANMDLQPIAVVFSSCARLVQLAA
jgi:hypothetical protein